MLMDNELITWATRQVRLVTHRQTDRWILTVPLTILPRWTAVFVCESKGKLLPVSVAWYPPNGTSWLAQEELRVLSTSCLTHHMSLTTSSTYICLIITSKNKSLNFTEITYLCFWKQRNEYKSSTPYRSIMMY